MICRDCGNDMSDAGKFCYMCGAELTLNTVRLSNNCQTCGFSLKADARFCPGCGSVALNAGKQATEKLFEPFPQARTAPVIAPTAPVNTERLAQNSGNVFSDINAKSSIGQKISLSATLFVLICFFLPWAEVSCMGARELVNGFDLASEGGESGGLLGLWLIPIAMIASIVLIYLQMYKKKSSNQEKQLSVAVIGCGALSLLVMIVEYFRVQSDLRSVQDPLGIGVRQVIENAFSIQFGAIFTLLGSIVLAVGGWLHLKNAIGYINTGGYHTRAAQVGTRPGITFPSSPSFDSSSQNGICHNCGEPNLQSTAFCMKCGTRV